MLDESVDFDPNGDIEALAKGVPARWVVYLLADAQDRPVQLLCVKNLRYSLKRRLGGEEMAGASRRVNYRELVRRIHWRRVDSALEADWVYLGAARRFFPKTYQGMVGFRPAWFVHVNPAAEFPRYTKTIDLSIGTGELIGPIEDKHAAARLIELAEDCFDLCRYYNILIQAPQGKACAYKEMGKCPAPCDGSIGMGQYRSAVKASADTMADPGEFVAEQKRKMAQAAAALQFELAGKIKAKFEVASQFRQGPFRHARRLADFQFLSLQRGPKAGMAKLFLITPGRIELIAGLIDEPKHPADLLRYALARAAENSSQPMTKEGAELVGVVAHHLFSPKQSQGVFLPLGEMDEKAMIKAYRDLGRQKQSDVLDEEEGVIKELVDVGDVKAPAS